MGNSQCFKPSQSDLDLRGEKSSKRKNGASQTRNQGNVFKQQAFTAEPAYVVESRVSLTQAAKENTRQILERQGQGEQSRITLSSNGLAGGAGKDIFQDGKMTFEPDYKPLNKAAQNHTLHTTPSGVLATGGGGDYENGLMSFGAAGGIAQPKQPAVTANATAGGYDLFKQDCSLSFKDQNLQNHICKESAEERQFVFGDNKGGAGYG